MLIFVAVLLLIDFSRIDNIPYHEVKEICALNTESFVASEGEFDYVIDGKLVIERGKGLKMFTAPVLLEGGDSLVFSFDAVNDRTKNAVFYVELFGTDFDNATNECSLAVHSGEGTYSGELMYTRDRYPDECQFRIFTNDNTSVVISNMRVDKVREIRGNNRIVRLAEIVTAAMGVTAIILLGFLLMKLTRDGVTEAGGEKRCRFHKRECCYGLLSGAGLFAIILGSLIVLYHRMDITKPMVYAGGDEMGIYYLVKTISKEGTTLVNPNVGGLFGGDMFDYPYSDKLSFLIVKLISLFTGNVYLITNLFYFLNILLNGFSAYFVCCRLDCRRATAVLAGALFAFCPYTQMRYTHMWLTPLYMIPVACLLAMRVIGGWYVDENGKLIRERVWPAVVMAFLCAFTGLYYAYFTCALIAAAWVISLVRRRRRKWGAECFTFALIGFTVFGVIVNVLPNIVYWMIHGLNANGQIAMRSSTGAEQFGLKLVQLVLPRPTHRISLLARLNAKYTNNYPLVNENMTASLGIVAAVGLVISLLLLFSKEERNRRAKEAACLNMAAFLIATVGGVGAILSLVVNTPMRCYNRMSVVIMFLSLLCIGLMLDRIGEKQNLFYMVILPVLLGIGLFDQTKTAYPYDYSSYGSAKTLLTQVQEVMEEGDMIFELPVDNWPSQGIAGSYKQFIGYIETDGLIWSYGSMEGREESNWQMAVAGYDTQDFLDTIRENGYDGVYLDRTLYVKGFDEDAANEKIEALTTVVGKEPLVSEDGQIYFWDIREKN